MDILKQIKQAGIVPAVKVMDADHAVPIAKALRDGGIPVAEITFRSEAALQAIRNIAQELPDVLLGAGTVLTVRQVEQAVEAGARYIVAPGLDAAVVRRSLELGALPIPGCITPSDITLAWNLGLTFVKLFPVEVSGGIKLIDALAGPFGGMQYMPTGGVNPSNLAAYLAHPKVVACGGSWMIREDIIQKSDWGALCELAAQAAALVPSGR